MQQSKGKTNDNKKRKIEDSSMNHDESIELINNLNNDCLVRIFKYLSMDQRLTIEKVCKRWRDVSELAWDDIKSLDFTKTKRPKQDVNAEMIPRTNESIAKLLKRSGRHLKELRLGEHCDARLLPIVGENCQKLKRLEMNSINTPQYDKKCMKLLPKMDELVYLGIQGIRKNFPRGFFNTLPRETLTELHLWGRRPSRDEDGDLEVPLLREAASAFQDLQKLTALTLEGFSLKPIMLNIITQMSNLKFLSIANCCTRGWQPDITLLKNLEHLNVKGIYQVDDDFLFKVSENCKSLKYLNISEFTRVDNSGIKFLQNLPQLEELIMRGKFSVTDACLGGFCHLKKLDCEFNMSVQNRGIIQLMRNSQNLESLNLDGTGVTGDVIREANQVVKRRNNQLELKVRVGSYVTDRWVGGDFSPLLIVDVVMRKY